MSVMVKADQKSGGSAISNMMGMFNTGKDLANQFKAKPGDSSAASNGPDFSTGTNPGNYGLSNMQSRMEGMKTPSPTDYFKGPNPYSTPSTTAESDVALKSAAEQGYAVDAAGKAAAMDGEFGANAAAADSASTAGTALGGAEAAEGGDTALALL